MASLKDMLLLKKQMVCADYLDISSEGYLITKKEIIYTGLKFNNYKIPILMVNILQKIEMEKIKIIYDI